MLGLPASFSVVFYFGFSYQGYRERTKEKLKFRLYQPNECFLYFLLLVGVGFHFILFFFSSFFSFPDNVMLIRAKQNSTMLDVLFCFLVFVYPFLQ